MAEGADGLAREKGGKTRPQEEKHSLKPLRNIEIHPEAGSPSTKVGPCCYEYQVEMDKTRAFLRTRTSYLAIPVRLLAVPGKSANGPGLLLSVDDKVGQKQAISKYHQEVGERHRSPYFFRRNLWWLLALFLVLFGDFLHVDEPVLAAWLTPPYAVTGGLLLALWAWSRWPKAWRRKPGDLRAKIEALGESIPFADNLPGTSFGQPDTRAAQRLALDFAEGRVSQVSYTYFNIPSDEGDDSIVVLNFILIRTDCTVLFCRHEVKKYDALFFVCEDDVVRLLGRVEAGKMRVDYAANLTDGHVYSDFSLLSLAPERSASKSHWRFFLWIVGQTAAMAGGAMAAFLVFGFVTFWPIGLLAGFDPAFWEMLGLLGLLSAAALVLTMVHGAWRGLHKGIRVLRVIHALGLPHPGELISRQRVVCNQGYCQW